MASDTHTRDLPVTRIQPITGWMPLNLGELWRYREMLYFLVWRDVKVRYKQTAIGMLWAIIRPFATMIVFSVVFGTFARIPSDDLPYPVFAYVALLPWTYFSSAVGASATGLVSNGGLIGKIYFPRLIIPLISVITPLADFAASFVILLGMMLWYGLVPTWNVLLLPVFLLCALLTALAVGIWLSTFHTRYRDVGYAVPFLLQAWMYASPVVYPVSLVPEPLRLIYSLNPMTGVIEGFRWALLGADAPDFGVIAVSMGMVLVLLVSGMAYFKRVEDTFADVI